MIVRKQALSAEAWQITECESGVVLVQLGRVTFEFTRREFAAVGPALRQGLSRWLAAADRVRRD